MTEALAHLRRELAGIRSGRASPGLLEHVVVGEASHGRHVQLHKLGTVVARNPQLLVVEVYDKSVSRGEGRKRGGGAHSCLWL